MFNKYYVKENNTKLDALINKFYQPNYRLSTIYRQSIEHLNSIGSTFSARPNNAVNISQRVFFMVNSDIFNNDITAIATASATARTGVQATPATPSTPFTPGTFRTLLEELADNQTNLDNLINNRPALDTIPESPLETTNNGVHDRLLRDRTYLLNQFTNHSNALAYQASREDLNDIDANAVLRQF